MLRWRWVHARWRCLRFAWSPQDRLHLQLHVQLERKPKESQTMYRGHPVTCNVSGLSTVHNKQEVFSWSIDLRVIYLYTYRYTMNARQIEVYYVNPSGVTIGPADPTLQGGAVSGGRKIVRKCGTFFGKLNCSNSNCTRFRLELYIFLDFFRHFHYFVGFRFSRKHLIKLLLRATGGAKWANGAPAGGHPKPTFRHCTSVA